MFLSPNNPNIFPKEFNAWGPNGDNENDPFSMDLYNPYTSIDITF